jgi:hypothetical protein
MPDAPQTVRSGRVATATEWISSARIPPVTGHKFFLLFLFLLADLVFYPYVGETSGPRYYLFRALGIAVTLVSVYAVSFRRGLIFVALLLAVPAMLQRSVLFRSEVGSISVVNVVFSFVFDVFIIAIIFRRVFAREKPTAETIFGAVCIYLMIGFTFARLYAIIATVRPHAFYLDPATNSHSFPMGFDFIFFSFGTMTSLGAAGIMAVSPQVRSLSVIESILGVLYLAVMISRLMGAYHPGFPSSQGGSADA